MKYTKICVMNMLNLLTGMRIKKDGIDFCRFMPRGSEMVQLVKCGGNFLLHQEHIGAFIHPLWIICKQIIL